MINQKSGSGDFFPIAELKIFSSCNMIQQIKKVWPNRQHVLMQYASATLNIKHLSPLGNNYDCQ